MRKIILWFSFSALLLISSKVHSDDFITKDFSQDPKSQGLKFSIDYPGNWKCQEGKRPHVLCTIGNPPAYLTVMVKKLSVSIPDDELDSMLSEELAKEYLPEDAKSVSCQKTKLEGLPVLLMEYTMEKERMGIKLYFYQKTCLMFYKNYLLQIQSAAGGQTEQDAKNAYDKERMTFMKIFNSLVILSKYK